MDSSRIPGRRPGPERPTARAKRLLAPIWVVVICLGVGSLFIESGFSTLGGLEGSVIPAVSPSDSFLLIVGGAALIVVGFLFVAWSAGDRTQS